MLFVLARIPLLFGAGFLGWWLARAVRPITDLIPGLHSFFDPRFIPEIDFFLPFSLWSAIGFVFITALLGGFRLHHSFQWSTEIPRILLIALIWGMAIISYFAIVEHKAIFSRIMLAQAMLFAVLLTLLFLFFLRLEQRFFWKKDIGTIRIFLLGKKKMRDSFRKILKKYPEFSLAGEGTAISKIKADNIEEVWHVDTNISFTEEQKLREMCQTEHKVFRFLPESTGAFARMELQIFGGMPMLRPVPAALEGWGRVWKRSVDIFGSFALLLTLSPLFLTLAIGVKSTSSGPIFYSSKRVGRNGKEFRLWKFRSMVADAEKRKEALLAKNHRKDGPFFKMKNDPRITPFGKQLRRFSLDELPQLWNVFMGNMSLIGPRPHLPEEMKNLSTDLKRSLSIRPGISGLAQVSGRSDLSFSEEMRLDMFYLDNWSIWMDMKIFVKTIWVVVKGDGAD